MKNSCMALMFHINSLINVQIMSVNLEAHLLKLEDQQAIILTKKSSEIYEKYEIYAKKTDYE